VLIARALTQEPALLVAVGTTAALLQPDGTLQVGVPEDVVNQAALAEAYGEDVLVVQATAPDGTILRSCVPLL
jgi:hypothetical protein